MKIDILLEAVKDRGDLEARWDDITPEKSIFQVEIGKNDSKRGWYYTVYDGKCTLNGGIYSEIAGIFEDKEMNKYAEKTSKQLAFERSPDFVVSFANDADFDKFIEKCRLYSGKLPVLKGSRKKGSKCDGDEFCSLISETAVKLFSPAAADDSLEIASQIAVRSMMRLVFDGLREGDDVCCALSPAGRKSWYITINGLHETDWITVQGTQSRVGINPAARPISSGGIEFESAQGALESFCSGEKAGETCVLWDAVSHMLRKEKIAK